MRRQGLRRFDMSQLEKTSFEITLENLYSLDKTLRVEISLGLRRLDLKLLEKT